MCICTISCVISTFKMLFTNTHPTHMQIDKHNRFNGHFSSLFRALVITSLSCYGTLEIVCVLLLLLLLSLKSVAPILLAR